MRISRKKPKWKKTPPKRHRTNDYIKVPMVRLIDEAGENYGEITTAKAMEIAKEKGLDLVEVSPKANPPVAKIIDYSKLKYQEEKERRKEKAKQKKVEVKGIRISLRISEHDKEVRIRQAEKFLGKDDKVKIEMNLRGRERQHKDLARQIVNKFIEKVNSSVPVKIEQAISIQGGKVSVIITKQ